MDAEAVMRHPWIAGLNDLDFEVEIPKAEVTTDVSADQLLLRRQGRIV